MNNLIINNSNKRIITSLAFNAVVLIAAMIGLNKANATVLSSTSYEASTQTLNDNIRATVVEQNNTTLISDQFSGKATGQTRNELLTTQPASPIPENQTQGRSLTLSITSDYLAEFSIYDAQVVLQNDFDNDGYYQTASVIFDADIYTYDGTEVGEVYAKLYLSEQGGPWVHYYTTEDFIIYANSDQDSYEVITTFSDGYYPGHYDILIDLYQVGYSGIVATYSSEDNTALFDLPLESASQNKAIKSSVYIRHAGSFSTWSLLLLALTLLIRFAYTRRNKPRSRDF